MQIEFSPLTGLMFGINYAYYDSEENRKGLHLIQLGAGLVMIQISWET
jgi:hypothetical protein